MDDEMIGSMSLFDWLQIAKRKDYGNGPEPDRKQGEAEWRMWLEDQSAYALEEWRAAQRAVRARLEPIEQGLRVIAASALTGRHPEDDAPIVLRSKDQKRWLVIAPRFTYYCRTPGAWLTRVTYPSINEIMQDYRPIHVDRGKLKFAAMWLRARAR